MTIMMNQDIYDDIWKENKTLAFNIIITHTQNSPVDCDGVQSHQRQNTT